MKARLIVWWERLRASFWFVPALMTGGAIVLALLTVALDEAVRYAAIEEAGWLYTGGPEGARALLSTVASSVITVAGVTFSITIAVLTLASSQFGPRLLRTFVRDTGNQVVLGTFIATFMYCLLVLRTVRGTDELTFVPHISVTLGVLLAIASLGVLIYFIHHVAVAIQADHIIAAVSHDIQATIERLFPEELGQPSPRASTQHATLLPLGFDAQAHALRASDHGYIQLIDTEQLLHLAREQGLVLRLERRPGDFVVPGEPLLSLWPPVKAGAELDEQLRGVFVLGSQRTLTQDVAFALNQLVEIAVRALSPGINDPFTAISCIDYLGAALAGIAERQLPEPHHFDDGGRLRVVAAPYSDAELVTLVIEPIRDYGRDSLMVTLRLLDMVKTVARRATRPELLAALRQHAQLILDSSREGLPEHDGQQQVLRCVHEALMLIDSRSPLQQAQEGGSNHSERDGRVMSR
jgi:uncharacterized membrane protein